MALPITKQRRWLLATEWKSLLLAQSLRSSTRVIPRCKLYRMTSPSFCTGSTERACNLGNMWCRLALAWQIKIWSATNLQHRLVKADGQACPPYWLLLTEGHLHRHFFGQMLQRIWGPPVASGQDS